MNYPLTSSTWGGEEYAAVCRVLASGRFTMGEETRLFEEEFGKTYYGRQAVMVNSGSSANLVAVAAMFHKKDNPLRRGDEVIVPAVSWATTYHPLQQYGLRLRFVDVDLETLNIDVKQLKAAATPRTRMIVAVNILGNPCDFDELKWFCDAHGLYLFEDNCESMGANDDLGRMCGTFGDVSTFSMFYSHHMSTMEGGMVLTNEPELAALCRIIRNHGWDRTSGADPFFDAYRFVMPGYNVRPLEISAAAGREQLKKLHRLNEWRVRNAVTFRQLFAKDERFILQRELGESSWFAFTFVVKPHVDRDAIFDRLRKAGIEFRMITGGCFTRHEAIKYFDYTTVDDLPNANMIHDRGFFVGNHPRDLYGELCHLHQVLAA